jgi:adenylyl-sulfate kinase
VTIFFTGLSGSGKSTIANVLMTKFLEVGGRPVTIARRRPGAQASFVGTGFSKEHRDINIRRIGYVASEITKNGGIAICAPIAPYDATRKHVRQMIEPYGGFILVHIATTVEVCEQRDRKGLYAKARAGILKEFTGISDPYEVPADADVTINTGELSAEEAAQEIILHLEREGFIGVNGRASNLVGEEGIDYASASGQNSGWICCGRPHRHDRGGGRCSHAPRSDLRLGLFAYRGSRFRRAIPILHQNPGRTAPPEKWNGPPEGCPRVGAGKHSRLLRWSQAADLHPSPLRKRGEYLYQDWQ